MAIIETISIVRPLKVIAFISLIVAIILLIVSLATTTWLKTESYRTGLFEVCTLAGAKPGTYPADGPDPGTCGSALTGSNKAYVRATAALLIIALLITIIAVILTVFGLLTNTTNRKYISYRIAMYVAFFAVLLEIIALIVFPVCFYTQIYSMGMESWDFDWSYGVAWGAVFFTFGAALLLLCDKEAEEIYYKEKTIYTPAAKDAPA